MGLLILLIYLSFFLYMFISAITRTSVSGNDCNSTYIIAVAIRTFFLLFT